MAPGHDNTASGSFSFAAGWHARNTDELAAVFSLSEEPNDRECESMGTSSVNFCVDAGVFVNGVRIDPADVQTQLSQQVLPLAWN